MSFAGKLAEMGLPELLQYASFNKRTGRLTLRRPDRDGVILFRGGRIIYAATNSIRETFGNILVCRGLIGEETLLEALERQNASPEEKRLGAILVEMGRISASDLHEVMRHQTGTVLSELLHWRTGFFKFEALSLPECGEVEVDARDFVVYEGLSTDRLLLDFAVQEEGAATASIRDVMAEVRAPVLEAETTLAILRRATEVVSRGVLFAVRGEELCAVGHFGMEAAGRDGLPVRALKLPLTLASVFTEAIRHRAPYRGPLEGLPGNDLLARRLGGGAVEVVVIPMSVDGRVVMAFYGDNLPEQRTVVSTRDLERTIREAGELMEERATTLRS